MFTNKFDKNFRSITAHIQYSDISKKFFVIWFEEDISVELLHLKNKRGGIKS